MLFAGWEVRIVKTVTEVLKMLPEAAGQGQHFQARGHSLSRQITYLFTSCYKLAYKWVYATLSLASVTRLIRLVFNATRTNTLVMQNSWNIFIMILTFQKSKESPFKRKVNACCDA